MVVYLVSTRLPTRFGDFKIYAYKDEEEKQAEPHLALVKGTLKNKSSVLVRIHSECLTGDVFWSMRCDCGEQLSTALQAIEQENCGVLIYLRQEGRGIGLINKLQAYELQDQGLDTVDANLVLGFGPDHRHYKAAIEILKDLGVLSVRLLTNNPGKVSDFDGSGIRIIERVPIQVHPNHENMKYLRTKRERLGHFIDLYGLSRTKEPFTSEQ
ncbi:MAG: GTP cyclohydrolase II [Candidatus Marinimicrobia bacterium]|nr:GTP cyclohydrolase II [Candidatus Neomarinimicrobiota bacterium]